MLANRAADYLGFVHMVWKNIGEFVHNRLGDGCDDGPNAV